jgi:hypothetical protein
MYLHTIISTHQDLRAKLDNVSVEFWVLSLLQLVFFALLVLGFARHNINFENSYSGGCINAMIDQSWMFERCSDFPH